MATTTRTKGYVGTIVSGKKLTSIAKQIYKLQYGNVVSDMSIDDFLYIVLDEKDVFGKNKTAIVCTEGVGWYMNDYRLIEIPTNIGQYNLYNGKIELSPKVIESCLTEQVVDIADYIREFGDRLDNNCRIWQDKMVEPTN